MMHKMQGFLTLLPFLLFPPYLLNAKEKEWGDLEGRFVFDGVPPDREQLTVNKDSSLFPLPIFDESLLVNMENRGLANVVLYLLPKRGQPLDIHATYESKTKSKVKLAMDSGTFKPHIVLLRTTQTMVQTNQDSVAHNARIDFINNSPM